MDEKEIEKKIQELLNDIKELPGIDKKKIKKLAEKKIQKVSENKNNNRSEVHKILNQLRNNLDFLRLHILYLVFDLEATRRENAYLRKILKDSN